MNAKRKSNSVVTVQQTEDGKLVFNVLGAGSLTFDPSKAGDKCNAHAALHGWKQRISDAAAISRNDETGRPASPAEKFAAMQELIEYYHSGPEEWSRVGTGSGGSKSLTIEAICRVQGKDYAAVEAEVAAFAARKFEGDTKKALAFLRQGSRVAEAMEAIRKERMPQPKVDADAALAELGA